ncbi:MAG: hemerythrin domain-containing protein [Rikenellaceae bacterium]
MITYKVVKYLPEDLMSDLICDNYPMLLVMSRFGIDLGFGDSTIQQVCQSSNVEVDTFLAVVNILVAENKKEVKIDYSKVSLTSLIDYLHSAHAYFLEYRLPSIRQKLNDSLDPNEDVSVVIVNYFDEYIAEVNRHMMYEEQTLFPYIRSVIEGNDTSAYNISVYSEHHDRVESRLMEFKNIIIKYYPAKTTNQLNNVLYDIFSCEKDLASHNSIEDLLLVPTMRELELVGN